MNSNISQTPKEPSRDVCLIIRCDHIHQCPATQLLALELLKGLLSIVSPNALLICSIHHFSYKSRRIVHTSLHHSKHPPLYSFMIEWCCQPFLDFRIFIIIEVELFHQKVLLKMCKYVLLREKKHFGWNGMSKNLQPLVHSLRDGRTMENFRAVV